MRRKVMLMHISAVIMSAVLSMSSVTIYADTSNNYLLENNNFIRVSLPASIDLSRNGNKFTGSGSVFAMYEDSTDKVDSLIVTVDTSVDYINTEDSSKKVTGSVSFGVSGVESWAVDELTHSAEKDISVEVPLPKSGGTYKGIINYNIASDDSAGFSLRDEVDLSEYEEMILDSAASLYSDKNIDSEVLAKLEGNSKVYIISSGEEDNGIWYEVYTSDEVRGWIFIESSGVEEGFEAETEESTETEEEAETEVEENTETEEESEDDTESDTEEESESSTESDTEEDTESESSTDESTEESSETEESTESTEDSTENTESSTETQDTEESSINEGSTPEESESDESAAAQEDSGVEPTDEVVVIEEGGENIPEDGDSDIPEVKIEAEIKDESQK